PRTSAPFPYTTLCRSRRVPHDRTVRNIEEADAKLRGCGGLRERRRRWNHRVEQGQADCDARAFQHRSAGKMLLREISHGSFPRRSEEHTSELQSCEKL